MFSRRFAIAALCGVLFLLTACKGAAPGPSVQATLPVSPLPTPPPATSVQSPLPTPTAVADQPPVTPAAGAASVVGRLVDAKTAQPLVNQNLSLPSVVCPPGVAEKDKREQCVYAVDEAFDPSAITDQAGRFVFKSVKPGDYVMIVGNTATKYTVLTNDAKQPLMWTAQAGQVLDLGDLAVDLP